MNPSKPSNPSTPSNPYDPPQPKPSGGTDPATQPVLSESQLSAIRAEADRYRAAQRQLLEALGVLWNAQLDVSIAAGRAKDITQIMLRPVAFYDDCSCTACW